MLQAGEAQAGETLAAQARPRVVLGARRRTQARLTGSLATWTTGGRPGSGHDLGSQLRLGEHDWRLGTSGRSTPAVRKQSIGRQPGPPLWLRDQQGHSPASQPAWPACLLLLWTSLQVYGPQCGTDVTGQVAGWQARALSVRDGLPPRILFSRTLSVSLGVCLTDKSRIVAALPISRRRPESIWPGSGLSGRRRRTRARAKTRGWT